MLAWEIAFPLGVLLLGVALALGLWRNHRRDKSVDPVTEAATREEYDHPDRYDHGGRDRLAAEAERRRRGSP